jgi:3-hydroxybutyryl-CoA dehydrogenase
MSETSSFVEGAALADDLLAPLLRDAVALERDGFASAADIDAAMRLGAGHPRGPLAVLGRAVDAAPPEAAVAPAPLRRVGVVGAGTMATGIAEAIAKGGGEAVLVARSAAGAQHSKDEIAGRAARSVARGRLTQDAADALAARVTTGTSLDALAGVELVVEAVVERLDVKQELFAQLERAVPEIPLATNTSSFRVRDVSALMDDPGRALALHFFNPAAAMKLVEVVGHEQTDPRGLELGSAWARSIGKQTVTCGDESGFLVNRLLIPYLNDAARTCAQRGVSPASADEAVVARHGHPMGPFALMDLIGIDVMVFALETLRDAFGAPRYALRGLAAEGRLGRKTGAGFLRYD